MAGQAQKKAAKAANETASFYGVFLLLVNAVYLLWLASHAFNGACLACFPAMMMRACVRA
jgi:hypothetical protein